jgi:hypothetical protein
MHPVPNRTRAETEVHLMCRFIRAIGIVGAVLVLAPAALIAQTPEQRIERALERAGSSGVPVELLQSKVAEGRAKKMPPAIIANAIERRLDVLQRVQASIGTRHQLNTTELGVAADAVQSGVNEAVLNSLAQTAPRERRAAALEALRDLVVRGHSPQEALQHVTEALQRGPEALMNLPARAGNARGNAQNRGPQGVGNAGQNQGRGGPPSGVPPGKAKPPKKGGS